MYYKTNIMTTNVYAIEYPCDDSFYGFQLDMVCDSFDKVFEKLKEKCYLHKYIYCPDKKYKYERDRNSTKEENNNIYCYKPSV